MFVIKLKQTTLDTIKNIAFFPLNICLLPGEDIPLKIFEPRYKQLINDCDSEKFHFGIPFLLKNEMQMIGSEVKLKEIVAKNSHDEMVIMVEGVRNFELIRFNERFKEKLYSGGTIRHLDSSIKVTQQELIDLIHKYSRDLVPDFLENLLKNDHFYADSLAKALNLSSEDKFNYLKLKTGLNKERFLQKQIEYLYKLREQENFLNNDFYLN